MRWKCDICGNGHYEDHTNCENIRQMNKQNEKLSGINDKLESIASKLDKIIELLENATDSSLDNTDESVKEIRKLAKEDKIEFAPQNRIFALENVAVEFINKILDMDYHKMTVTDGSLICDFADTDEDRDKYTEKMLDKVDKYYNVDIRKGVTEPYYIVDILEFLKDLHKISDRSLISNDVLIRVDK